MSIKSKASAPKTAKPTTAKATRPTAPKSTAPTVAKGGKAAPAEPRPARTKAPAKAGAGTPKRLSGLDAAAQVLAKSAQPMNCAQITEAVLAQGLWKTKGKTPAGTLSAAIGREITLKGKDARFRKAGRGLYAAAGR
jgi:hypothetical protein